MSVPVYSALYYIQCALVKGLPVVIHDIFDVPIQSVSLT